jgi:hypothetical protein
VNDYYASKSFANMALATGASTSATAGPWKKKYMKKMQYW